VKDLVNIQDFLVTPDELGDWDGEEEVVADKLNELLHFCWSLIPDEMEVELIERTLCGVWDNLRGDTVILDVDMDQLQDWVVTYVHSMENAEN
jgi:hypothetical protein